MTDIVFQKVKIQYEEEHLIIFERGKMEKPICILTKYQVEKLAKEWNTED